MKKTILYSSIALFIGFISLSFTSSKATHRAKTSSSFVVEVAPTLKWYTDFTKANAESTKTGKPIFGFFTGSDWCGWCRKLKAAVFVKDDFKQWADSAVILLELDFPRRKKLPAKIAQQNRQLAQLFKVRGYPTVWLFTTTKNAETNQMNVDAWGQLSYPRAEAGKESQKFIGDALKILAKKKK